MRELIDLVRAAENYDSTLAAARNAGKPIEPNDEAWAERARKGQRIAHLRSKWNI